MTGSKALRILLCWAIILNGLGSMISYLIIVGDCLEGYVPEPPSHLWLTQRRIVVLAVALGLIAPITAVSERLGILKASDADSEAEDSEAEEALLEAANPANTTHPADSTGDAERAQSPGDSSRQPMTFQDLLRLILTGVLTLLSPLVITLICVAYAVGHPLSEDWKLWGPGADGRIDGPFRSLGIMAFAFLNQHTAFLVYLKARDSHGHGHGRGHSFHRIQGVRNDPSLGEEASLIDFSHDLGSRNMRRWVAICFSATGTTALLCLSFALSGYLAFGSSTRANVLQNLPDLEAGTHLARILLAFNMVNTYPTQFIPCRLAVLELLGEARHGLIWKRLLAIVISVVLFTLTLAPALLVRSVGPVFELAGSVCSAFIAYILPPIIFLAHMRSTDAAMDADRERGPRSPRNRYGAEKEEDERPLLEEDHQEIETPRPPRSKGVEKASSPRRDSLAEATPRPSDFAPAQPLLSIQSPQSTRQKSKASDNMARLLALAIIAFGLVALAVGSYFSIANLVSPAPSNSTSSARTGS